MWLACRIEDARSLDVVDRVLRPAALWLVEEPTRRDALHGRWLGHAVHPPMTDLPLGLWVSGSVLDLTGGRDGRTAARRLIGLGVAAALPTAVTGLAEWAVLDDRHDRRTGVLHATANVVALAGYAGSWLARRRGRHAQGVMLALAAGAAAGVGGFLGGHLVAARKVSSRHPVFDA